MKDCITMDGTEHQLESDFWTDFNKQLERKHLKAPEVYKNVGLTNRTFSSAKRFKKDGTMNPSRNESIRLAVGLELTLPDTENLLAKAGFTFSPCNNFDVVLKACKKRGIHNVFRINHYLYDNGLPMLMDLEE